MVTVLRIFTRSVLVSSALVALALCASLAGCVDEPTAPMVPPRSPGEAFPGGEGSVSYRPFPSFELPAANLPVSQRPNYHAGKALGNQPWIKSPTITDARDGLGPLYNARTCLTCHIKGGRGVVPESPEVVIFASLLRLSVPGEYDPVLGIRPEPVYGDQVQGQSVALSHQLRGRIPAKDPGTNPEAPPEARVYLDWHVRAFQYPDGEERTLRFPALRIEEFGYGPLAAQTQFSLRAAPAIHGLGLLEAIGQDNIDALADPEDIDGDGVSGRVNQVWDFERGETAPGRFGWKANRTTVRIATAAAFQGDVGISNPIFPDQPCTEAQQRCRNTTSGNNAEGFELPEHLLALTVGFVRDIGVPVARKQTEQTEQGRAMFYTAGCAGCHQPSYTTRLLEGELAHLGGQEIWPYTDLLLHDMGPDLADGRPDYQASGSEWRTPPLWGIGLSGGVNGVETLLHDGRARDVEEAILWHGGEAGAAREVFVTMSKQDREALIEFVKTL